MAITGVDSLIANLITSPQVIGKQGGLTAAGAGTPHTPWYASGIIGAGSAPTGGLNGATFVAPVGGAISVPAAVTGETSRLAGLDMTQAGGVGAVWIIDRLWGNVPVVTTTTSQAITSPTWPARDTSASTNGGGVMLALECSSATGNGSPITNTTVSYTNSAGTAARSGAVPSFPATAPQGTFVPLSLSAGDIGVRSVQSITLGTSYVSGQVGLIAYRLVASIPVPTANVPTLLNYLQLRLPAVWDLSVLQLVYWPTGTSISAVQGSLTYAQG